ncbi:hypothetical protein V6N13_124124 [Hibiscus sabdariffa]|uniref:Uncharacterized protein n=1 Tax=Hibiscus sabdariffa TaxID=183260 RepID=A0ABR2S1B6_9ROSI
MLPGHEQSGNFKILGYQWCVLCLNDDTRQSTVKIMVAYWKTEPSSIFIMQQPQCTVIPSRQKKAMRIFPRPMSRPLRPIVHGQILKYNMKLRVGRGFTLEELKV